MKSIKLVSFGVFLVSNVHLTVLSKALDHPPIGDSTISMIAADEIKIFNAGNYIMLQGKLNGKLAYFMIDTGASYTVLHSKSAKLYDFQVLERKGQQTTGFGGNQALVQIAIGANIHLGDQVVSMGFLAQDISKVIRLVHSESKVRIAGIIGSDLLKRFGCSLDIGNKVLITSYGG